MLYQSGQAVLRHQRKGQARMREDAHELTAVGEWIHSVGILGLIKLSQHIGRCGTVKLCELRRDLLAPYVRGLALQDLRLGDREQAVWSAGMAGSVGQVLSSKMKPVHLQYERLRRLITDGRRSSFSSFGDRDPGDAWRQTLHGRR